MKTNTEKPNDVIEASDGGLLSPPPCSAEWYRKRAEEVRHNGKTVSQYNHFLGVSEAIERAELERDKLRGMLKQLIAFDDLMNDETWEDHGTYAGAYYAYYKGNYKTWDEARALLPNA